MVPAESLDSLLGLLSAMASMLDFTMDSGGLVARGLFVAGIITMLISKPQLALGDGMPLSLVLVGHCAIVIVGPIGYVSVAIGMGLMIGFAAAFGSGVRFGRTIALCRRARLVALLVLAVAMNVAWVVQSQAPQVLEHTTLACKALGMTLSIAAICSALHKAHAPEANWRVCLGLALVVAAAEAFPWPWPGKLANYMFFLAASIGIVSCALGLTWMVDLVIEASERVYAIGRPYT